MALDKASLAARLQRTQNKVVGHALTVKFQPALSRGDVDSALAPLGLSVRRVMGFAPNLFLVTGPHDDFVSKAKLLNQMDGVIYAEPVLIEPAVGGRS